MLTGLWPGLTPTPVIARREPVREVRASRQPARQCAAHCGRDPGNDGIVRTVPVGTSGPDGWQSLTTASEPGFVRYCMVTPH
jgi:hypothetical protein